MTIAVTDKRLKLIEMHPHSVFASRNLGGIGSALDDRGDNYRIASCRVWRTRDYNTVSDCDVRVFGQSLVDCDRALRWMLKK